MSTLIIRKKSLKTWLHTDSILGDFIISKFYFNADNLSFQIVEQGQSRRVIYNISDITLYALPSGGTAETFANITALSLRLEELNYPAFQYDGQITSIANLIDAGTGVTITGDGTEASPYVINSTGGVLQRVALPFTTDHLTATGNQYNIGDVVYYIGNVYRCIAANDSLLPTNTLYWTNLGAGNPLVQQPADWNATNGNNQILNKPTISTNPTLAEVLIEGNLTDGEDISISDGDKILLDNGANLKKGTTDAGLGGSKGIALRCAVDYELKWEAGRLYVMGGDGFTIREVSHNFTTTPTVNDDTTKGFIVDSRWILDDGNVYVCTDATTGAAVWDLQDLGTIPTLQQVLEEGDNATINGVGDLSIIYADGTLSSEIYQDKNVASITSSTDTDYISLIADTDTNIFLTKSLVSTDLKIRVEEPTGVAGEIIIKDPVSETETVAFLSDITVPTLQEVTDADNITTNDIKVNQLGLYSNNVVDYGYLSWRDDLGLSFKNHTTQEVFNVDKISDSLSFINSDDLKAKIQSSTLSDNRVYQLPDADGTLALTTDIPTLNEVTTEGNVSSNDIQVTVGSSSSFLRSDSIKVDDGTPNNIVVTGNKIVFTKTEQLNLTTPTFTATRTQTFQDADGTLALLSDITGAGGGIPHATAAGTNTYTATITGITAYNDADAFLIRFTNGNTSSATLNINGLGAIPLYRNNDGVLIGGDIINGGEMLCVYNSTTNRFQVIGTAPNSLFAYVTNDDSVTLTKGMPVYAFGGTGDRMTVKRANNTGDATSAQTVGLVLSTSIAANQKGLIMMQGLLDGLSILPTATFADGDPVYLGATAGTITNVKPYAPNHLVYLGVVTTASNGSAGRMYVRIQNGYELSEIHDIDLITNAPTNNQVLTYESSTDLWKNKSLGTILGYTPYRNVQTSQTALTGTVAETIVFTATIPAGSFNSVDVLKILFGANKTTGLGAYTLRLRVNTTNTISGAPTIATYVGSASSQVNIMMRNFNLNGGNLYGLAGSASGLTDIVVSGSALGSNALNPANTFYLFATVQLTNILDSIVGNMFTIHN